MKVTFHFFPPSLCDLSEMCIFVCVSVSVSTRESVRAGQRRDIFARVMHKAEQEIKSGKDGKKMRHRKSKSPT